MLAVKFGKLKAAPQISVVVLNPSVVSAPIGIIGKNIVTSVTKKFVEGVLKKSFKIIRPSVKSTSTALGHLALNEYKWVINYLGTS